jgi:flagellar hook-basal body complex protein FliE
MADFSPLQSNVEIRGAYSNSRDLKQLSGLNVGNDQRFEDLLRQVTSNAIETVREGDAAAVGGLQGTVGVQQVVEATMALESTVKISVAIRDKLIGAYQDILKMPV